MCNWQSTWVASWQCRSHTPRRHLLWLWVPVPVRGLIGASCSRVEDLPSCLARPFAGRFSGRVARGFRAKLMGDEERQVRLVTSTTWHWIRMQKRVGRHRTDRFTGRSRCRRPHQVSHAPRDERTEEANHVHRGKAAQAHVQRARQKFTGAKLAPTRAAEGDDVLRLQPATPLQLDRSLFANEFERGIATGTISTVGRQDFGETSWNR